MYFKRFLTTIVVIAFLAQASKVSDPFYLAGVVEFRPASNFTSEARTLDNLNGYLSILNSEAAKGLDIIVFPESTLNNNDQATFVPNPAEGLVVPCDIKSRDYHSLLVQLSCAAKKLSVYLVINVSEKEWCDTVPEDTRPCADSGLNFYNTNVVFDRKGAVISRYRKVHLYGENKNTTFAPEMGSFETDFGIRFGHFICFDILFYAPAQSMVEYNGIKDFIFPSMWFSQLPFLTAVQVQQAWSFANNVNLLAAGSSNPLVGSTGSGIYHGRQGIVSAKMNLDVGERKLYIDQVPKYRHLTKRSLFETGTDQSRTYMSNIKLKTDFLLNYETVPLDLITHTNFKHKLCFNNTLFCCNFQLSWQSLRLKAETKHYHYRLGVYDGLRNDISAETNQLKNCALFSCIGGAVTDCGKTLNTDIDVVFEKIIISATFPKAERFLIMPNSLNANMMPLPVNNFQWREIDEKNTLQVHYELNTSTHNVMAFSIYGNYYDTYVDLISDIDDKIGGKAASLTGSLLVMVGVFLINLILIICK